MFYCNNSDLLSNATIGEDDLRDVLWEINPVAARWQAIGIGFGLEVGILEKIEVEHSRPNECMTAVLKHWLNKNYNVERFGKPTWRTVVKVVGHSAAGEKVSLASEIAKKYPGRFDFNLAHMLVMLHNCTFPTSACIMCLGDKCAC